MSTYIEPPPDEIPDPPSPTATATAAPSVKHDPPTKPEPVTGRPVTLPELIVYAERSCSSCAGTGVMSKVVDHKQAVDKKGKLLFRKGKKKRPKMEAIIRKETCGCAWRNFREAFGGITVEVKEQRKDENGRLRTKTSLFWPGGETLAELGLPIHVSTVNARPACIDTEADVVKTDRPITCDDCRTRLANAVAETAAAEAETTPEDD